jgi:PPK2 family polyphosphate:nucleotide phosphotransferase
MKIRIDQFLAKPNKKILLSKYPSDIPALYSSKSEYQEELLDTVKDCARLQNLLYADNRYSLLLIFQAMDAAGKDSAIKRVMSGINPQGCQVFSFKQPSAEELDHDFLWRTYKCLPERGRIGIFNRSYYEEVLVVRVHPEILQSQGLPATLKRDRKFWEHRLESIRDFEKHLSRNGTRVIKFFLNVSQSEQQKRFLTRMENPEKNWKFNAADFKERKLWKKYMSAYETAIAATSTADAPWYIVPADDKKNTHLIVSKIIAETLQSLKMSYPTLSKKQLQDLSAIKKSLR